MRNLLAIFILLCSSHPSSSDDPEAYMTAAEMIQYWGYPVEEHDVHTGDGYILHLIRIPHGRFSEKNSSCFRPAILMAHGLFGSAPNFFMNPPESSSAFILADAGFDVFLLNQRGTAFGMRHVSMHPGHNKFWQFTMDEFAKYDAPASIDKALELSGQTALYWMGHSQGTIVGFMALAENPAYNRKVKALFQLSPVGTLSYLKGTMRFDIWAYNIFKPILDMYRQVFGSHELIPSNVSYLLHPLSFLCQALPPLGPEICHDAFFFFAGPPAKTFNESRFPVYAAHIMDGSSSWNFLHWGQIASTRRVDHMDHNPTENRRRYGQATPPPYNYSNVESPVYLFNGRNDWITPPEDVENTVLRLLRRDVVKGRFEVADYNHRDFTMATNVAEKVFNPIAVIVRSQEENMCHN